VIHGFNLATGREALLCMDADLQHPPEKVSDVVCLFVCLVGFVLICFVLFVRSFLFFDVVRRLCLF
jgi:hypothetical protein